ncbi:hypothetical protein PG994_001770 [Apiospora phragmitis]|uniref:Uncharacterized protein n=1 Tax=Apiospora phragmitis TaxID=2905665 RepID=A0ABR1WUD4_9PEZI
MQELGTLFLDEFSLYVHGPGCPPIEGFHGGAVAGDQSTARISARGNSTGSFPNLDINAKDD